MSRILRHHIFKTPYLEDCQKGGDFHFRHLTSAAVLTIAASMVSARGVDE